MLSYQHGYHAGGFADVVKHLILSRLIHYLIIKPKPLFYLETHSGKGIYDLKHKHALKTGEAMDGIERLWVHTNLSPLFKPYLTAIKALNHGDRLQYYPGSPLFAIQMLRPQDRQFFCELHPSEFECLKQLPHPNKRVFFSHSNGLQQLKAQLPPLEKRALVFIDPTYEVKTEYREITNTLKAAYLRFNTGVYCLWYPIIDQKLHAQLMRGLQTIGADKHLRVEFHLYDNHKDGMTGCGLWIINPPYTLQKELNVILTTLRKVFNPGFSSYRIEP